MKPVMFVSFRELGETENLKTVWDSYDGPKEFVRKDTEYGKHAIRKADYHGFGAIVTDDFLEPIDRKRTVKTIYIGHFIAGGKAYGVDWQNYQRLNGKILSQIDYFVSPSHESIKTIVDFSRIAPDRCVVLGSPRTDKYFGKSKGDGCTGYENLVMYLYVPTYRSTNGGRLPKTDWKLVDSMLSDDEMLVVKRHSFTKKPLLGSQKHRHIVEIEPNVSSTGYILDCDVLVTDYSSIVFDGYLCGKPSVLYCKDMDAYLSDRPMYHDYPSFYSPRHCCTEDELVGLLREAKSAGMGETERECARLTSGACDGHSTERVIELIRQVV